MRDASSCSAQTFRQNSRGQTRVWRSSHHCSDRPLNRRLPRRRRLCVLYPQGRSARCAAPLSEPALPLPRQPRSSSVVEVMGLRRRHPTANCPNGPQRPTGRSQFSLLSGTRGPAGNGLTPGGAGTEAGSARPNPKICNIIQRLSKNFFYCYLIRIEYYITNSFC